MSPDRSGKYGSWHIDAAGLVACAVLTLLIVLFAIRPVVRHHAQRAARRSQLVEQRRRAEDLEASHRTLEGQRQRLTDEVAASRVQLEPTEFLNARLALIVELASASGIDIHETRPGKFREYPRYRAVPIRLAGKGTYPDCAAFFHRLHESLPDTGVVAFELSGNPGQSSPIASFRFDLLWYAAPALAGAAP
ncbi:MAG: type 4a pilus biogenesis protein PilO [Planctomycetota bacterium]